MRVDLFDFELPRELIAARPADPRDSSRLLRIGEQGLDDRRFADLPELLTPGDMLVFNDTRVIPVRLAVSTRRRVEGPSGTGSERSSICGRSRFLTCQ